MAKKPTAAPKGGQRGVSLLDWAGGLCSPLIREQSPWKIYLAGFLLPFLLILIGFGAAGALTGKRMILAHDQWHQYYPFFLDLQRKLQNGGSLFYSWTGGLGTNYLSLAAYYLSSPMNLVLKFLPESAALGYYTFTVMLRIGLAGLFCTIFLVNALDRREYAAAVFGTAYALCSFIMGYYWNAIWLETIALLPLVALGTLRLLRDREYVLYVSTLALSLFCSYYIGFFTCIFVLLLTLVYNVCYWDDFGGFCARIFRMAFFSALAIGITAILTLPAYYGLQATNAAGSEFPTEFALNMTSDKTFLGLVDALRQTLGNYATAVQPTTMEGLPNVACGSLCLVMAIIYCCCGKIPLREKICACLLLLFFMVSFANRQLDYIWHGFHFPNMLPYRFSFLFSFVVIFMAYRAYTKLDRFRWYYVLFALPVAAVWLYCVFTTQVSRLSMGLTVLVILITLGLLLLYGLKKLPKSLLCLCLCVILLLESAAGMSRGLAKVGTTDASIYPRKHEAVAQLISRMEALEADTVDLWRAETTKSQTLNDNALNGYRGVSMFSSAISSRVTAFTKNIGMSADPRANRTGYQEADPFTNLLFNVKYLIDREGRWIDHAYFDKITEEDGVYLLENKYYLPLGFMVNGSAAEEYINSKHTDSNRFKNINALFSAMSGRSEDLFLDLPHDTISTKENTVMTRLSDRSYSIAVGEGGTTSNTKGYVNYHITEDCSLCVYTYSRDSGDMTVYINDDEQYSYSDKYGYLRYLGEFKAGDKVTLGISPKSGKDKCTVQFYAAVFNTELFEQVYDQWAAQTMTAESVTDTSIEGRIRCEAPGLFYTSIPYESGWTATVDGKTVEITPLGGAMIAFPLKAGAHRIVLTYETPGYSTGKTVTLICLAVFLLLVVIYLLKKVFTRPMEQVSVEMADGASLPTFREDPEGGDDGGAEVWTQTMPALEVETPVPEEAPATDWQIPEAPDPEEDDGDVKSWNPGHPE